MKKICAAMEYFQVIWVRPKTRVDLLLIGVRGSRNKGHRFAGTGKITGGTIRRFYDCRTSYLRVDWISTSDGKKRRKKEELPRKKSKFQPLCRRIHRNGYYVWISRINQIIVNIKMNVSRSHRQNEINNNLFFILLVRFYISFLFII